MNFKRVARNTAIVAGAFAAAAGAGGCLQSSGLPVAARVPPGVELSGSPGVDRPGGPGVDGAGAPAVDRPGGVEPDPRLTPGAVFPGATVGEICRLGYAASRRDVPIALKREVLRAYGVPAGRFTVDHLVPLELGGANLGRDPTTGRVVPTANLWPEPSAGTDAAGVKDRLENRLARLVCRGSVGLAFAQRLIARDWIAAARWVDDHFPRPP